MLSERNAMASLTIRNLEEGVKSRLRVQAASRGRSMEDEARHILRAALAKASPRESGLVERIRERFAPLGDVQLPIATREPVREPVQPARASLGGKRPAPAPAAAAPERRRG
jgi:plasmid stability protein